MDILDRLLGHDAWTTGEMLRGCHGLSDEELDRDFDIGHCTLRRTFLHVVRNMEVWTDLIAGRPVRADRGAIDEGCSVDGLLARLDVVAPQLAEIATRLRDEGRLDERWLDHLDEPPRTKSYGGAITHVLTHSMHHRAQILYLMRRLGVADRIEGDVLGWESWIREGGR
jgi:uncharacterized damage-inducible protein DinB